MNQKPTLKQTIQDAIRGYSQELVVLPGWPQYCVPRRVLCCLVDNAPAFGGMACREKSWLIAYIPVAGPGPVKMDYHEALDLYREATGGHKGD